MYSIEDYQKFVTQGLVIPAMAVLITIGVAVFFAAILSCYLILVEFPSCFPIVSRDATQPKYLTEKIQSLSVFLIIFVMELVVATTTTILSTQHRMSLKSSMDYIITSYDADENFRNEWDQVQAEVRN